jgi:chromate transporter
MSSLVFCNTVINLAFRKSIFRPFSNDPHHIPVRRVRYIIFLKDVVILAFTCFGGPQAHLARFLKILVEKHHYITEEELLEIQALCTILPGPTSTQTLTAIAFKIGGPNLAYLTLLIWILPSAAIMTTIAIGFNFVKDHAFARFLEPIAVGLVIQAGVSMAAKILTNPVRIILALAALVIAYLIQTPFITPIVVLAGGLATALEYQKLEKREEKQPLKIEWSNFILFITVPVVAAIIGGLTHWLPIRLFENFYRNGSLIFGGGHVLNPVLFTEFVQFKKYLSQSEFLSGLAVVQVAPGPVFSFASFIGALAMRSIHADIGGQIAGATLATFGIFLPGTFLIFFVYRFWEQLKQYRIVRASLEGITAASIGLIGAASIILLQSLYQKPSSIYIDFPIVVLTFILLQFTKIPQFVLILIGLLAGFIIH